VTKERRHNARIGLTLPVRVQGHGAGQDWTEMSSVKDASPGGVAFILRRSVARGEVLLLSLPLPKRFRSFDTTEASYRVYALVRDVHSEGGGTRVGVMFLGKHPPRGFDRTQGGRYLLPEDEPPAAAARERRQHSRLQIHVNIRLRRLEAAAGGRDEEMTIAENIGRGGARVLTSLPVARGEVVQLDEMGGLFSTRAEVRNIYVGPDRITRLNLRFLDRQAPDSLVLG
jgi:PilZ domain-containing protein